MANTSPADIPLYSQDGEVETSSSTRKSKKRDKPHIPLSTNQPPTTQGKPRERVYVACAQCRSRKIRCDGAKPCHNCTRRVATTPGAESEECSYDPVPKRRGPDKTPGSRQRRTVESDEPGGVKRRRRRTLDTSKPATASQKNPPIVPRLDTDLPPSSSIAIPSLSTPVPTTAGPSIPSYPSPLYPPNNSYPEFDPSQIPISYKSGHSGDVTHVEQLNYPYAHVSGPGSTYGYFYDAPMTSDSHDERHPRVWASSLPGPTSFLNERAAGTSYYDSHIDGPLRYPLDGAPKSATAFNSGQPHYTSSLRNLGRSDRQDYPPIQQNDQSTCTTITYEPSVRYTRQTWWDALLFFYDDLERRYPLPLPTPPQTPSPSAVTSGTQLTTSPSAVPGATVALTSERRTLVSRRIRSSILSLFRASNYWFAFFHAPSFLESIYSPNPNTVVQPALVYAFLAVSEFFDSSELERGSTGRLRSLRIRDEAQSALEQSWNSGRVDEGLAQAAWLLAFFEICAHDQFGSPRTTSAMVLLDAVIRSMNLIAVDQSDPHANTFPNRGVPIPRNSAYKPSAPVRGTYVGGFPAHSIVAAAPHRQPSFPANETPGCACSSFSLGAQSPNSASLTPFWVTTPGWSPSWSQSDIRKESCRRLCWSTMILAAGHISYTTATWRKGLDLYISDPANYSLFFTGEAAISHEKSAKETVWALYDRAFLLWHGCMRMRANLDATPEEKAKFGVGAWLEADELERKLNLHTCDLEKGFLFQGREYLFNTRMVVSYEFQSYIPEVNNNISGLFHRRKAEQWLSHQKAIAHRIMTGLHNVTGLRNNLLLKRPFFVFWFMGQISRALQLWECDHTMLLALECAKALMAPIDYLAAAWPCREQRMRHRALWDRLCEACYLAGVEAPPFPDYGILGDPKFPRLV